MAFLEFLHRNWIWCEGRWSTIIPVLLAVALILWLLLVYVRGRFRLLPAWAIARVTVQDSIGRLEVIVLLIIGMMIVGVNGIIPNTPQGRATINQWMGNKFIQQRVRTLTPDSSLVETPDAQEGEEEPYVEWPPPGSAAAEVEEQITAESLDQLIWQGAFLMADFFVAMIGFVLAMFILPTEINRGVILSILPKPLTRGEYIFGKFLGIWIIVAGSFLVLALELLLIHGTYSLLAGSYPVDWHLVMAMCLFPLKYAALVLIIMMLTLRMPEVPAGILGILIFATGHFTDRIYEIAIDPGLHALFGYGLKFSYWMLPHLSETTFSILDKYSTGFTNWDVLWGWVWQIMVYNCLLMLLLAWLFRRRSL